MTYMFILKCALKLVEVIILHILGSVNFLSENCAFCEIMGSNIVELDRSQMTIWYMRIACWIPKVTNTHPEYVILMVFPL